MTGRFALQISKRDKLSPALSARFYSDRQKRKQLLTNQIFLEHPYRRQTPVRTLWYFLSHNASTFVVAHHLSIIRNTDRIAVFEDGHIVEIGTQTELLEQPGIYARLQMQQSHIQATN
jgi:hypothetical protein